MQSNIALSPEERIISFESVIPEICPRSRPGCTVRALPRFASSPFPDACWEDRQLSLNERRYSPWAHWTCPLRIRIASDPPPNGSGKILPCHRCLRALRGVYLDCARFPPCPIPSRRTSAIFPFDPWLSWKLVDSMRMFCQENTHVEIFFYGFYITIEFHLFSMLQKIRNTLKLNY